MEKEVFLIGRWDNYDELEEALTLDELAATYDAIVEKEIRHNKFQARLAGADIKDDDETSKEQEATLEDRLRERTGKARSGGENGPTNLPTGVVGHQLIGG